jgi:hypothetical protein
MGRVAWVPAVLPGMVSWHAGIIALGAVIATGTLRLLGEWQRRTTLIALMRNAPPETVVHRDDKDIGSSILVLIGDGMPQPPSGAPVETKP